MNISIPEELVVKAGVACDKLKGNCLGVDNLNYAIDVLDAVANLGGGERPRDDVEAKKLMHRAVEESRAVSPVKPKMTREWFVQTEPPNQE